MQVFTVSLLHRPLGTSEIQAFSAVVFYLGFYFGRKSSGGAGEAQGIYVQSQHEKEQQLLLERWGESDRWRENGGWM